MKKKGLWIGIIALVLVVAAVVTGLVLHNRQQQVEIRNEALEELERNAGQYDEQSIVLYETSKAKAEELAELYGAKLRITENGRFATLTLSEGTTIRDVYAMDESLKYIEEMAADYQVQVSELTEEEDGERLPMRPQYSVSDEDYALQTYLDYLNMGSVWDRYTGYGVTVAVIDTGIDTDHPEFAGRISEYSYNATEDKIVKDWLTEDGSYDWSLVEDEQGHGTAVTGVIAASMDGQGIVGIAPNVNIIVIKAECDDDGTFLRTSDLVFGIYYAIERDVQVINMSFGTYAHVNPFAEATQLAYDSDIICVAAAGNESTSALGWPAADEKVIGVGALGDGWTLAGYSNFGENTNLVAPGTTYTCQMGGTYETVSGTSLASPVVAGAVALFLQNNPHLTFDDVTEVLYASSYDLGDLGRDWYYGFGALDVSAFILEERGTITYDILTDELENTEGVYIQGHTLQELPEPERLYAVFDGWYYDDTFTQEYNYYEDKFYGDEITLYAKWANEDDSVPYTYVILEDGTVEIRSYTGHRRYITIPEKIEGRVVSSIGDFAFSGQTRLREVTLPSGLKHIGLYAFQNCANLVGIHIPENVTEIEQYAFSGNVRLATVAFLGNSKLESIGDFAFESCGRLERIELPASLKRINGSAFYGATALYTIGVQQGNTAFQSRDGVLFNLNGSILVAFPAAHSAGYTLPEGTNTIGIYAFAFAGIREIDLANVTSVEEAAFIYAELESLEIPDSVIQLGKAAFSNTKRLTRVQIGRGLTVLPTAVFSGTTGLKTIEIPNCIEIMEINAFHSSGLQSIAFEEGSTLTNIGQNAFYNCALSEIDIPDSVTQISAFAFSGASAGNPLVRVGFGENSCLESIDDSAFAFCTSLQSIDLPVNLKFIGEMAFMGTALQEVTIPAGVRSMRFGAFAQCTQLTTITVEKGNAVYRDVDGVVYNLEKTQLHAFPAGKCVDTYYVENTVTSIMPWAFAGTEYVSYVVLPEGLTVISEYSFYRAGIYEVTLPESLVEIQQFAFSDCSNLTAVQIPDNVLQIGRYAFACDWNLQTASFNETSKLPRLSYSAFAYCGISSFRVPSNVSTMAQSVFEGCCNLTSITFAANSKLESISAYMFDGCDNLRTITCENGSALKSVQAHALEGMDKLTGIDFGDAKLTNIDNFAFRFCESLYTLNLPETVTNIGRYAFYGCKSLSQLSIPSNVEHIGSYAFLGTDDVELYFASETLPQYLDENWDHNIRGYYTGVVFVMEEGDYRYAVLESGNIAILAYLGEETHVDLNAVDLGAPITIIGGSAFEGSMVMSIVLPDTLTAIQAEAFAYSELTAISIPAGVTFIGREAFAYTDITSLTFEENAQIAVIEQYAFVGTKYLTSVNLPASLTTMGTGVFQESGLQSMTFAQGIQLAEISPKAFANTKLEEVNLPDSVTMVNHNAFNNVQTLRKVTFGNNEGIRLMSNAFYHTGLEQLHIPANVTYIGEYCFVALSDLQTFTVDENNPNYKATDGLLLSKNGRKLVAVPAGRTGSLTVPEGVEEIGFGAFEETKLSEINFLPDANILTFGYRAFFKAEHITTITIPASVVSIDYYAFGYCENLQEVIFAEDNQLKGIYEGAFIGCVNLENITIPDSIVEISDFAFYGCSKIDRLPISENNQLKGIYDYAFAYTGLSGEFTTPSSLWDIGDYAFLGTKLTKVTIPDTNKKILVIGIGAFEDCNRLEEITVPFVGASYEDNKISWFGYIFGAGRYEASETYVPESLKTVTLTEGVTTLYIGSFAYCTNLETINMPHSVSVLWNEAFTDTTAKHTFSNAITPYMRWMTDLEIKAHYSHFGSGLSGHLILADGVTEIESAFIDCTELTGITIPDSVTNIDNLSFSGCTALSEIALPSSVKRIGEYVFADCTSLKNIPNLENVTEIGECAFFGCTSLTEVVIPSHLDSVGYSMFWGCTNLRNVTIGSGVTGIGDSAFNGCTSLTEIQIPESVVSIGEYAFYGCTSLTEIQIPGSVASIGNSAFYGCTSLTEIQIPGSVASIGNSAFYDCTSLAEIQIPEGVTSIGECAFFGCTSLTHVTIAQSVTEIGQYAFGSCCDLCVVTNYSQLQIAVGSKDFGGVARYAYVVIDGEGKYCFPDETWFATEDQFLFTDADGIYTLRGYFGRESQVTLPAEINGSNYQILKFRGAKHVIVPDSVTAIGYAAFWNSKALTTIETGAGVSYIGSSAFYGCTGLTEITLGENLTQIGYRAFYGCTGLESVEIPKGVTEIPYEAFSDCDQLTNVILPDGLRYIGESAFRYCSQLASIHIPDSVTSIGSYSFQGCRSLTELVIPASVISLGKNPFPDQANVIFEEEQDLFHWVDGILYNEDFTRIVDVDKQISGTVVIADGVREIPEAAFMNCQNLSAIVIPDSVTTIGGSAFHNCSGLRQVTIGNGVTSIGGWTFYGCNSLEDVYISDLSAWLKIYFSEVNANPLLQAENLYLGGNLVTDLVIPDDCTRISDRVFYGYDSLTSVTIPEGVTSIGDSAFARCTGLTELMIPEGVISIGDSAFSDCTGLTKLTIPEGVTSVGNYTCSGCTALTDLTIPSSVTSIGYMAFDGCTSLAEIQIPESVISIGDSAFAGCTGLTELMIPEGVISIGDSAFAGCTGLTELTIPEGVTSIGEDAFNWCNILVVINQSQLEITVGNEDFGCVALYAIAVIDGEGNYHFQDDTWFKTDEDFVFTYANGIYQLRAYLGRQETVVLPADIHGSKYDIYKFQGAKHVVIPDGVVSVGAHAFHGNCGLESITIPDSVTSIGAWAFVGCDSLTSIRIPQGVTQLPDCVFAGCEGLREIILPDYLTDLGECAFQGCRSLSSIRIPDGVPELKNRVFADCSSLTEISIPDSVIRIEWDVFENCTALLNAPENYRNGMVVVDGWLIDVDENVRYLTDWQQIRGVARHAYYGCDLLKTAVWDGSVPDNVETIYITRIRQWTGALQNTPLTVKHIVIADSVEPSDLRYCPKLMYITGVTVYVEVVEADLRWNAQFPDWNNGNVVVYGDKWSYANFYDADGTLLSTEPVRNSQVIHRPAYQLPANTEGYTYEFLGWDLNGDGIADSVPATTTVDIQAAALVREIHTHVYADWFTVTAPTCTEEGLQQHNCKYCDYSETRTIAATGHSLVHHNAKAPTCTEHGWEAYDTCEHCDYTTYVEIAATGHSHEAVVTAPTCTEQGYTTHTCHCGDTYVDSYTDALGHAYGEWYTVTVPSCTEDGLEQHDCTRCEYSETCAIAATGHSLVHHDAKAPTCTEIGWEAYDTCEHCDYTTYVENAATGHTHESVVTDPTCTERGYTTHTCHCGDTYVDSYTDALGHAYGEWYTVTVPSCTEDGLERHDCTRCDHSETRAITATGHSYESVVTDPTCTEQGYTTHTCHCGDTYVDSYTDALGHSYVDGECVRCGEEDPNAVQMGDANGDGNINYLDAIVILQYYTDEEADGISLAAADVNGDEEVNYLDAMMILQFYVGELEEFPAAATKKPAPAVKKHLQHQVMKPAVRCVVKL